MAMPAWMETAEAAIADASSRRARGIAHEFGQEWWASWADNHDVANQIYGPGFVPFIGRVVAKAPTEARLPLFIVLADIVEHKKPPNGASPLTVTAFEAAKVVVASGLRATPTVIESKIKSGEIDPDNIEIGLVPYLKSLWDKLHAIFDPNFIPHGGDMADDPHKAAAPAAAAPKTPDAAALNAAAQAEEKKLKREEELAARKRIADLDPKRTNGLTAFNGILDLYDLRDKQPAPPRPHTLSALIPHLGYCEGALKALPEFEAGDPVFKDIEDLRKWHEEGLGKEKKAAEREWNIIGVIMSVITWPFRMLWESMWTLIAWPFRRMGSGINRLREWWNTPGPRQRPAEGEPVPATSATAPAAPAEGTAPVTAPAAAQTAPIAPAQPVETEDERKKREDQEKAKERAEEIKAAEDRLRDALPRFGSFQTMLRQEGTPRLGVIERNVWLPARDMVDRMSTPEDRAWWREKLRGAGIPVVGFSVIFILLMALATFILAPSGAGLMVLGTVLLSVVSAVGLFVGAFVMNSLLVVMISWAGNLLARLLIVIADVFLNGAQWGIDFFNPTDGTGLIGGTVAAIVGKLREWNIIAAPTPAQQRQAQRDARNPAFRAISYFRDRGITVSLANNGVTVLALLYLLTKQDVATNFITMLCMTVVLGVMTVELWARSWKITDPEVDDHRLFGIKMRREALQRFAGWSSYATGAVGVFTLVWLILGNEAMAQSLHLVRGGASNAIAATADATGVELAYTEDNCFDVWEGVLEQGATADQVCADEPGHPFCRECRVYFDVKGADEAYTRLTCLNDWDDIVEQGVTAASVCADVPGHKFCTECKAYY